MSALEDSLRKVYKLPTMRAGSSMDPGFYVSPPPMTPEQQAMAKRMSEQFYVEPEGGFTSMNMDPGFYVSPESMMTPRTIPSIPNTEDMSPEDKKTLESLLQKSQQASMAPLSQQAQELAMQGEGDDTQLAHLRQGEVVLPPEFFEDEQFEDMVEKKFKQFDIDPEQAIVGTGIASLNSVTGLEQFGFFKKIGKSLKKVVKKVAPIAAFIPGVGTALGGVLGGVAGKVGGALGLKGTLAKKVLGGIGGLKIPGISSIAGGASGGFGSLKGLGSLGGMLKGGPFGGLVNQQQTFATDEVIGTFNGQPVTRADLGNMTADQFAQVQLSPAAQQTGIFGGTIGPRLRQTFLGSGQQPGVIGNILGGGQQQGGGGLFGGGFGDALKMGGIGALAAGLGKLAYEDAQKQKGVPLTPLTTMSPTGRYNIEAEIARRMGQPTPNPVEFGLLPSGTLPELSGGKPRGMQEGGSVNKMRGLAMRAGQANNIINQLETTFNPNNMRDLLASNLPFDPTAIENLLTSAEKKQYDRAKLDFTTSLLRKETGAVINESEIDYIDRTFFPQLGDDEEIVMQKRQARQQVIQSLIPQEKPKSKGIESMQMMMYGGPVMAYAEGGAVQMQEGGEMDPNNFPRMDGDINGPGTETSDDIPAMLSDGEFVMTGRAVRGAGSYEMQADPNGIISLMPTLEENRERGMDLMYKMMDTFADKAKAS